KQPQISGLRRAQRHDCLRLLLKVDEPPSALFQEHVAHMRSAVAKASGVNAAKGRRRADKQVVMGLRIGFPQLPERTGCDAVHMAEDDHGFPATDQRRHCETGSAECLHLAQLAFNRTLRIDQRRGAHERFRSKRGKQFVQALCQRLALSVIALDPDPAPIEDSRGNALPLAQGEKTLQFRLRMLRGSIRPTLLGKPCHPYRPSKPILNEKTRASPTSAGSRITASVRERWA